MSILANSKIVKIVIQIQNAVGVKAIKNAYQNQIIKFKNVNYTLLKYVILIVALDTKTVT